MHYLLNHNVERVSQTRPENVAFRFSEEQLNYGQLDLRAGQLAASAFQDWCMHGVTG